MPKIQVCLMKLRLQRVIDIDAISCGRQWGSLRGRINNKTQKIHGTDNHALKSNVKTLKWVLSDVLLHSCSILPWMCSVFTGPAASEPGSRYLWCSVPTVLADTSWLLSVPWTWVPFPQDVCLSPSKRESSGKVRLYHDQQLSQVGSGCWLRKLLFS